MTEITAPTITVLATNVPLPAPVVIGAGGRMPPASVIEDDVTGGNAETGDTFDPDNDGLDFWEWLEGMRVQVNNPLAVGPTKSFGSNRELPIVGDNGANASTLTPRGGIIVQASDFNPERIILNDLIAGGPTLPQVNTGAALPGPIVGVIDYSFGNYKLQVTAPTPFGAPTGGATPRDDERDGGHESAYGRHLQCAEPQPTRPAGEVRHARRLHHDQPRRAGHPRDRGSAGQLGQRQ